MLVFGVLTNVIAWSLPILTVVNFAWLLVKDVTLFPWIWLLWLLIALIVSIIGVFLTAAALQD
jgi:hypothetical protein